jgi:NADPH-dependent 2,4-dienoyl-CoA reductase/sulfur reductase-like enzyme
MKHVILGAGPAGVIAAETIRKNSPYDDILIVGDEPEPPYSRMAIPYLLMGNVGESGTHLRHDSAHFSNLRIGVRQARCTALDSARRTVTLSDGAVLPFDTLLIATGSTPMSPPIPGIDSPDVHPCWTLADARAIQAKARKGQRVVQMGAGFIGCIIMEALASRGVELTVVEMGDRMVPRMMGPTAGGMIKAWCEKKGVKVHTGARVESIAKAGAAGAAPERGLIGKVIDAFTGGARDEADDGRGGWRVKLSNGKTLGTDLIISATGVKPNTGFLQGTDVKCLLGVLTDEHMQTSVPGIYAAGDCAEAFDKVSGKAVVSAIQPNAADQAYVAAMNMSGRKAALKGVTQINVLDTLGLVSTSFGNWQGIPGGEHAELTDAAGGRHLSLQFKGDVLVGCNSVGWNDHVGVMRGLVEGQIHLGEWKHTLMKDPTQLMPAYLACAQAQDKRGWLKVA